MGQNGTATHLTDTPDIIDTDMITSFMIFRAIKWIKQKSYSAPASRDLGRGIYARMVHCSVLAIDIRIYLQIYFSVGV